MKRISHIIILALPVLISCKTATEPEKLLNQKASLPESFKLSALHQKVITSFINNRNHTTSVLYGNNEAVRAVSSGIPNHLPGQAFTLVTWQQQDDAHWFGARIPGDLISAETLSSSNMDHQIFYHYQKFLGRDLVKLADTTGTASRIKFILSQRASIAP